MLEVKKMLRNLKKIYDSTLRIVFKMKSNVVFTPDFCKTGNERVYLILKTTVRLSHPAPMDLVLRKRLCLNIYKRQSITDRIRRRIVRSDWLTNTGVTYEVVSNIPKVYLLLLGHQFSYLGYESVISGVLQIENKINYSRLNLKFYLETYMKK